MLNPFDKGYFNSSELQQFGFKKIGTNVIISKQCVIVGIENISIGDNCRIDDYCSLLAVGGHINIGDHVHIGGYCYLNGGAGLDIESFANLSQGVRIYSKSDNYDGSTLTNPTFPEHVTKPVKNPVKIGQHCIIGSGTTILPGAILEDGAAVGALSLAKSTLKAWHIHAGVPTKIIKQRAKDLLSQNEIQ